MKGLKYQLKNIRRDKMCILTFLLPIIAGIAIHLLSGVNLQTVSEASFGILKNDLSQEASLWLKANGNLTQYETPEELYAAINDPSTQIIGVLKTDNGIRTLLSGDELTLNKVIADTSPGLYRPDGKIPLHKDHHSRIRKRRWPNIPFNRHNTGYSYVHGRYLQCHEHHRRKRRRRRIYQPDTPHDGKILYYPENHVRLYGKCGICPDHFPYLHANKTFTAHSLPPADYLIRLYIGTNGLIHRPPFRGPDDRNRLHQNSHDTIPCSTHPLLLGDFTPKPIIQPLLPPALQRNLLRPYGLTKQPARPLIAEPFHPIRPCHFMERNIHPDQKQTPPQPPRSYFIKPLITVHNHPIQSPTSRPYYLYFLEHVYASKRTCSKKYLRPFLILSTQNYENTEKETGFCREATLQPPLQQNPALLSVTYGNSTTPPYPQK